jgi:TonB family protein
VLIHVVLILAWPNTTLPTLASGGFADSGHLQVVTLGALMPPGPADAVAATVIEEGAEEDEEEPENGASGEDGTDPGGGSAPPEGWEGRSAELWRLAALRPRMADPPVEDQRSDTERDDVPDTGEGASSGEDREGLRVRDGTEDLAYQRLSEEEMLSLERLSALRPELVLVSPSSWLVVRNPREVGAFLRERFDYYGMDGEAGGSLSVSLWVDERGSVEWAEINQSSGQERIDASAIELFRNVVAFRPAREEGMRVPVAAIFWLMW